VTYFCIMIIVTRVEDRKAVLGLFNFAYELHNGKKYASCSLHVCCSWLNWHSGVVNPFTADPLRLCTLPYRNMDISHTADLPSIHAIIDNRHLALFGHVVRLDARIPAHQALKLFAAMRSSHQPDACWSRVPGHPCYSQQIGDGMPLGLTIQWKIVLIHGHSRSSLPASAAFALHWWWWTALVTYDYCFIKWLQGC